MYLYFLICYNFNNFYIFIRLYSCYSDTAAVYRNEEDIGDALKKLLPKYNLKREDIFITTKLGTNSNKNLYLFL